MRQFTARQLSYLASLVALMCVGLACGGTVGSGVSEANVRVTGLPQFVCPTSTPRPTHTALPTLTQLPTTAPRVVMTPMVYSTYEPVCNYSAQPFSQFMCVPNACFPQAQKFCATFYSYPIVTPNPPGFWWGGGTGSGPTSTPRATHTPYPTRTPWPTPTPYIVSENYAMGADVYVGGTGGLELRFRISQPRTIAVDDRQQVVVWDVEIGNVGTVAYHALPGAQSFVSHLMVGGQALAGYWYASVDAAHAAGITLDPRVLDIVVVQPNQTVTLALTAFTPVGSVYKLAWILDPYSGGRGDVIGGNTALWVNEPEPEACIGNVGSGFVIPTPGRSGPTPTPSVTPYIPPYSGYRP
jgi:hypothetical protein